jgi:hypothetical protein
MSFVLQKTIIKIFDNNFRPDITMSSKGIPKYIEWKFITDEKDLEENDVVVYTDQWLKFAKTHKIGRKIAWILEPPVIHKYPYDYIKSNSNEFDLVMNFCTDFLKECVNGIYIPNILSFIDPVDQIIHKKLKLVSLIFSKKTKSKNHRFRQNIVDFVQKEELNIDTYGEMVNNFVVNKIDSLRDYMYHIVVENCNVDGYYSEKTLDCFLTGTIPIIYGKSCICNVYDKNGMYFFNTLAELKSILLIISDKDYDSKLKYINKNYLLSKKYPVVEDYIYENYIHFFKTGS